MISLHTDIGGSLYIFLHKKILLSLETGLNPYMEKYPYNYMLDHSLQSKRSKNEPKSSGNKKKGAMRL